MLSEASQLFSEQFTSVCNMALILKAAVAGDPVFPSARVPEDVQAGCSCSSADRALAWPAKDPGILP